MSEFGRVVAMLREFGVAHSVDHAPCAGKGAIGKDEAIQQKMLDLGHNITSHCTTGIQIGALTLVFFTGASDVKTCESGCFLFTLNRETREITDNTNGRRAIASES